MFTWLNKQGVRSDRGFEVQRTGRFDAEYSEGGRMVQLYVEDGFSGGPCLCVEPDAFARWKDGTPIAPEQQTRMMQNLKEAMEFQGIKLVVEKRESLS